jgi:hypothetical protein
MKQENLDKYMVFIEDEAIEVRRATRMMALQLALCGLAVWTVSAVIAVVAGLLLDWPAGVLITVGLGLAFIFGYILFICWLKDLDDRRVPLARRRS